MTHLELHGHGWPFEAGHFAMGDGHGRGLRIDFFHLALGLMRDGRSRLGTRRTLLHRACAVPFMP